MTFPSIFAGLFLKRKGEILRKYTLSTTFLAILACFLWSTAFAGIKVGLQYTDPLNFAGIRFFMAGLLIMPMAGTMKNYVQQVKTNFRFILKISFFQTFTLYTLFYTGISMVPGALAAIVVGASPLFASVMAHYLLYNDKMTWLKTFSISFGLIGVVIIAFSRGKFSFAEGQEFWGLIILILANLSGNFGNILVARDRKVIAPLVLTSSQIMIGGFFIFLLSIPLEGFELRIYPWKYYASLGWLSFLSASAFSIWFTLLKRPGTKVSYLNIWKFIIPVFGAMLSWMIIPGENAEWPVVIGMIVICISLVTLNLGNLTNGFIKKYHL